VTPGLAIGVIVREHRASGAIEELEDPGTPATRRLLSHCGNTGYWRIAAAHLVSSRGRISDCVTISRAVDDRAHTGGVAG
jgi:hypothetical protein